MKEIGKEVLHEKHGGIKINGNTGNTINNIRQTVENAVICQQLGRVPNHCKAH